MSALIVECGQYYYGRLLLSNDTFPLTHFMGPGNVDVQNNVSYFMEAKIKDRHEIFLAH